MFFIGWVKKGMMVNPALFRVETHRYLNERATTDPKAKQISPEGARQC